MSRQWSRYDFQKEDGIDKSKDQRRIRMELERKKKHKNKTRRHFNYDDYNEEYDKESARYI